ncbi:DUF397 domain-containing protein [Marinitenerispora sediminis]|uniref:DUF397 domain-containing protein n=1 Tax=Marinitenerispora sediminis TaxID=1931232 RepID=A0A368TCE4_9ACTN|nr:DUF397 domain-containing protein [Marinitenerispora sediminis]RCV56665.1 DUF397 domain-containing protein [Marinitenerispora sediminis]RCV61657.1 DUF397 domain-containing protein [Marinitenerispora sediminis]RCV62611.1 DUF397 domain-containing protein [Marinitenerispora sediminis]
MFEHESTWHKSSYSAVEGSCVEVAEGPAVLVRDTQHRHLGHLTFSPDAWTALLHELKTHTM